MVCKSRKEAMRRYLELKEKMGWKDDNDPKPANTTSTVPGKK